LIPSDHSSLYLVNSTVNGYVQIMHETSMSFSNVSVIQWSDLATGAGSDGTGVMCLTSSECYLSGTTISGRSSGDPTAPSFGVQVASTSRLTFTSGRVTGFDVGVQVGTTPWPSLVLIATT